MNRENGTADQCLTSGWKRVLLAKLNSAKISDDSFVEFAFCMCACDGGSWCIVATISAGCQANNHVVRVQLSRVRGKTRG